MWRKAALGLRAGAIAGAAALCAIYAGCGDLVVASTATFDGGGALDGTIEDASSDAGLDAKAARLDCAGQDAAYGPPTALGCTGLYRDWAKKEVSPEAKEYDPGLRAWNDGAESTRWIAIPPGRKIDTSDMNEWRFPVGTKVWSELRLGGRRVETRHLWKRAENEWARTTYRWSDDETRAVSLTDGATDMSYAIPTAAQCDACHGGREDRILGFEAVSLSTPDSKYAGQSPAMAQIASLLSAPPSVPLEIPNDASGKARAALGWLHANCGTACHNANGLAATTGLSLRLEIGPEGLGAYTDTPTYRTAVCQRARIRPHEDWTRSLVPFRSSRRDDPFVQMPPLASTIADARGAQLLQDWVMNGSFPARTGPGERCAR